jgi:hypothetical protein
VIDPPVRCTYRIKHLSDFFWGTFKSNLCLDIFEALIEWPGISFTYEETFPDVRSFYLFLHQSRKLDHSVLPLSTIANVCSYKCDGFKAQIESNRNISYCADEKIGTERSFAPLARLQSGDSCLVPDPPVKVIS